MMSIQHKAQGCQAKLATIMDVSHLGRVVLLVKYDAGSLDDNYEWVRVWLLKLILILGV